MPIKGWLKERWMSPYNKADREAFTTGLIETSIFLSLNTSYSMLLFVSS